MAEDRERTSFTCPNCDHPIVTVPEHYHVSGALICPGCGTTVEPPEDSESLLDKAEHALSAMFKGKEEGTD